MKRTAFFAADLGATSGRTILATLKEGKLFMEEINRFPNHLIELRSHFYWDIFELYRNILEGLSIVAKREDIELKSIGIDSWGCDFILLGKDGEPLGLPHAYRDPYTNGAPEKFFQKIAKNELYNKTGIQIMNFNSLFQLATLKETNDSSFRSAKKMLFTPDAISYFLTGNKVTEYTIASTSQLLNARTRKPEKALLEELGINEAFFGKLIRPGERIGTLSDEVQKITGLGNIPVIAVAGHDTASAVAAIPVCSSSRSYLDLDTSSELISTDRKTTENEHFAYLSSGTWSLMGIECNEPIINSKALENNFTNEGGIDGTIRFLKNITGMWLLERSRKDWEKAGRTYTYSEMEQMAKNAENFSGRIDPDNPRFANPENMDTEIKNYLKESGQETAQNDSEVISCIYHSLVEKYASTIKELEELSDVKISKLHIIGGGSANNLLNSWIAETLKIPVIAGPKEATAAGNILMQIKAAGLVKDRWEMREIARNTFAKELNYFD